MWNPIKTFKKVGKNFGLLALGGALAALSPETVGTVLVPLGPWGPLLALAANTGLVALADWRKHTNRPKPVE